MNPVTKEKVNILLVDDQPANLLALEAILSELGENLVKAQSGHAALRALLEREFAVILLDVQMPDLDGFETASLIRERHKSRDTPIIFLTALSRNETHVFRGYELGAVDYIFKPFHPEVLRAKVSVFVELFRKREAFKRQAQELARLSRQNELILKAAVEGIFGVDLHGISTFVNPSAARIIGRRPEDVTGRDIHSVLHPSITGLSTCDLRRCALYAAMRGDTVRDNVEDTFFRDDGTSFPVEFCVAPIHDGKETMVGSVITFRDVTEKRTAVQAAESERRYREAEAQNRAKDNFLAMLSHELRTPMTSILGWVQFLGDGDFTPEDLHEALQTIESSAQVQTRLINDMLDVSSIVLGKFHVDLRPTRLAEIVEAAVTAARPDASDRGILLISEIESSDDLVEADETRLKQVIGNILSNAIKFTPQGKRIVLKLGRLNGSLCIQIRDEGDGIDPAFLPHVFERLRQGREGPKKRSGLGLGLAIARHIVELHQGEITAESDGIGKGATFTVTLPVLAQTAVEQKQADARGPIAIIP